MKKEAYLPLDILKKLQRITQKLGNRWRCFIVKTDLQNLDHGLNGATPL